MKSYVTVPWLKVHDYLLQVGSCRTIPEFMRSACTEVEKLIPFETAGFHNTIDARCLYAVGQDDRVIASYNDYYRTKQPGVLASDGAHLDPRFVLSTPVIEWKKYNSLEYATDFMFPNGMFKTIAHAFPVHQVTLSAHRSRLSPDFTDADVTIMGLLNQHLNIYWSFLVERKEAMYGPAPSEREIGEKFCVLTSRETELCSLLARRLTTSEIARCLFISRRTVEKHVESVFQKLDVRSREQLRLRLGVQYSP